MRIQKAGYFLVSLACAQFTFAAAPQILNQPHDQSVVVEHQAVFFVQASGSNLSYQWFKNGAPIQGATTDQLVFEHAHSFDNGRYSVFVSNPDGNIGSDEVGLSVKAPVAGDLDCSKLAQSWIDGSVNAMAVQADGKILIGGSFLHVHGPSRAHIARLEPDGTTDFGFPDGVLGVAGGVSSIILQSDGKILVAGGSFEINGDHQIGVTRLNSDGSVDQTFQSAHVNGGVSCMRQQPDGKLVIGGSFDSVNGVSRGSIARLLPNGALDTDFQNGESGTSSVNDIALQADGKIILGGGFNRVNGSDRRSLARLNADGTLDDTFMCSGETAACSGVIFFYVTKVILDQNQNILVSGYGQLNVGGYTKLLVRLDHLGTVDTSFVPFNNWDVTAMTLQADNTLLFAGSQDLNDFQFPSETRLFRADSTGAIDNSFPVELNNKAHSILLANGKIFIGGVFDQVNGRPTVGVARLESDGILDESFGNLKKVPPVPLADSYWPLKAIIKQNDDKILVGSFPIIRLDSALNVDARFTSIEGSGLYSVAVQQDQKILIGRYGSMVRLNADGSRDNTFANPVNLTSGVGFQGGKFDPWPTVEAIAVQTDGKLIIGGYLPQNHIKRLNSDGTDDASFSAAADLEVHALALQPDGMVLLGGKFTSVDNVSRGRIARVDSSGNLDNNFLNGLAGVSSGSVEQIVLQNDGKILIAGDFSTVNGVERNGYARLNTDGTLDQSFQNTLQGPVTSIAIQADGRIIVTGAFIGGYELARLNADGSIDSTFHVVDVGSESINATLVLPDGNILIGGTFSIVNNQPALYLAELWGNSPSVANISSSAAGFNVEWNAFAGKTYHLQYKDSLAVPTWTDLPGDPTLNASTATKADSSNQPQRFYRVVQD